jgi:hypothetical protein
MAWLLPRLSERLASSADFVVLSVSGEVVMDVGITKSNKNHPILHFVTGLIIVTVSYSAVMFAVRAIVLGV